MNKFIDQIKNEYITLVTCNKYKQIYINYMKKYI